MRLLHHSRLTKQNRSFPPAFPAENLPHETASAEKNAAS
jgi:hypothetical protein